MKRYWSELTSPEFAALYRSRLIAVLPVSAIEQHGPHLPMSVDTTIIEGIVDHVIQRLPDDVPALFLPTQRIGKSNEHARYPGTLTLSLETLVHLWMEIGDCVAAAGVRKMVIFNSHGGQGMVGEIVARDLRVKHDMLVVATNTYSFGTPPGMFTPSETQHGIHGGTKRPRCCWHCAPIWWTWARRPISARARNSWWRRPGTCRSTPAPSWHGKFRI